MVMNLEEFYKYYGERPHKFSGTDREDKYFIDGVLKVKDIEIKPIGEFIVLSQEDFKGLDFVTDRTVEKFMYYKTKKGSYVLDVRSSDSGGTYLEIVDTGLFKDKFSLDISSLASELAEYTILCCKESILLLDNGECRTLDNLTDRFKSMLKSSNAWKMVTLGEEYFFKPYELEIYNMIETSNTKGEFIFDN